MKKSPEEIAMIKRLKTRLLTSALLLALVASTGSACLRFQDSDFDNTTTLGNTILFLLIGSNSIFALGQTSTSVVAGVQQGLQRPKGVLVVGNKLIVSDNRMKRVLIYNSIPTSLSAIPDVVIGQADANTGGIQAVALPTNSIYLNDPQGLGSDGTRLFVVDQGAHRVLIWNTIPTANLTPADVVVGQSDFTSTATGSSATLLSSPTDVAECNGMLFISDTQNNRLLGYNTIPTTNGAAADFAVGQIDTTANAAATTSGGMTTPEGITCNTTQLYVADTGANRVLYFNPMPTASAANAAAVLGQTGFGLNATGAAANQMNAPKDLHIDTLNSRLYVADTTNHRVLIFNPLPVATNPSAVNVLGQNAFGVSTANNTSLANGMESPGGVYSNSTSIFVSAELNNRIMIWNALGPSNFATVDNVVGQPLITTNEQHYAGTSLSLIRQPIDVTTDGTSLFTTSDINNRALRWSTIPSSSIAADTFLGQPNANAIGQNNPSISGATMNMPNGICATSTRLYVADGQNHRILVWTTLPTTNTATADLVLGQANFTGNTSNAGGSAAQNTLNSANEIYCDEQRLLVSDSGNNRILMWTAHPTTNMQNADLVLGQTNFTNSTSGAANLDAPRDVLVAENKIIVTDSGQHRVLIWNSIPTTNGVAPDVVLGQTNFTNITVNAGGGTSVSAQGLNTPGGLTYYNGALIMSELFNNRILIWKAIPAVSGTTPDLVFGQADFTSSIANVAGVSETSVNVPFGMTVIGQRLYIADAFNHRVLSVPVSRLGL